MSTFLHKFMTPPHRSGKCKAGLLKVRDSEDDLRSIFDEFAEDSSFTKDGDVWLEDVDEYTLVVDESLVVELIEDYISSSYYRSIKGLDGFKQYVVEYLDEATEGISSYTRDRFNDYLYDLDIDADADDVDDLFINHYAVDTGKVLDEILELELVACIGLKGSTYIENDDDKWSDDARVLWPFILKSQGIEGVDSIEELSEYKGDEAQSFIRFFENSGRALGADFVFISNVSVEDYIRIYCEEYSSLIFSEGCLCGLLTDDYEYYTDEYRFKLVKPVSVNRDMVDNLAIMTSESGSLDRVDTGAIGYDVTVE